MHIQNSKYAHNKSTNIDQQRAHRSYSFEILQIFIPLHNSDSNQLEKNEMFVNDNSAMIAETLVYIMQSTLGQVQN